MNKFFLNQIVKKSAIIICGCTTIACNNNNNNSGSSNNISSGPWSFVGGINVINSGGQYSNQLNPNNIPGARNKASQWVDQQGNWWMLGGWGYDYNNKSGYLNDLWQYDQTQAQWRWVNGSNQVNDSGQYGTKGLASQMNIPSARVLGSTWTDTNGNLWLFGGNSYQNGKTGHLNDLWKFDITNLVWTWIGGNNTFDGNGTYGTRGQSTGASANIPGARFGAFSWTDNLGNFWLFGGVGFDSNNTTRGYLNDLWVYDFRLTPNAWVWVSGSSDRNALANYSPNHNTPSSSYIPGGRVNISGWVDNVGNLWVFGGFGVDSNGKLGYLNDLWMCNNPINYNPTTPPSWTWVSGSKIINKYGVYGTQNIPLNTNTPGARYASVNWLDKSGNLWLFGGYGYDAYGAIGFLNDLWIFNPTTSLWTWVAGDNTINQYGTNIGARNFASLWQDKNYNVWVFGGFGYNSFGNQGYLNDIWKFTSNNN